MKKKIKVFLLLFFLFIILIYVTYITQIPDSITLFKGEDIDLKTMFGISVYKNNKDNYDAVYTGVNINNENRIEKTKVYLKLFNVIKLKDIDVNIIPKTTVIPLGDCVGLKLYTNRCISSWNDRNKWNKTLSGFRNRRRRYDNKNK